MSQGAPVDQIPAMEEGQPGEVFKAADHEVVIVPDPANGGIGMETRKDRVGIGNERHGRTIDPHRVDKVFPWEGHPWFTKHI